MQLAQSGFIGRFTAAETATAGPAGGDWGWRAACAISVIPITAILHHAFFYHTRCMLIPFGPDYTLEVISLWLANDASLPVAILLALAGYQLGNRFRGLRMLMIPFIVAFIPVSLWVWDIPFSGRVICMTLHDHRFMLADGVPLKGRHLYLFGVLFFASSMAFRLRAGREAPAREVEIAGVDVSV